MLLLVTVITLAERQEGTTWQEAVPPCHTSHFIRAEQPVAERTLAHLYDERIVLLLHAASEVPGYHPQHSKSKCLHMADRPKHHGTQNFFTGCIIEHGNPILFHAIDYYIYALEHIII